MSERTPITVNEIRKGDIIRAERQGLSIRAHEFAAQEERDTDGWPPSQFNFYLLDRPAPKVELPSEPTLGWMVYADAKPRLGTFARDTRSSLLLDEYDTNGDRVNSFGQVKSFTPAVAVPREGLDELGRSFNAWLKDGETPLETAVAKFLAAVDKANGGDPS